jgi:hypothetical protein
MVVLRKDGVVGKDINDYLNHYVLIADGKAAALAAASLALLGLMTSDASKEAEPVLRILAAVLAAIGAVSAGIVLYPRTPHSGNGHIFWGDIAGFASAEAYLKSMQTLQEDDVAREYARQNFLVSGVLLKKNAYIRKAIWFLAIGCLSAAIAIGAR